MDGANVLKPYDPRNETRSLFNNPKWSDVRFLIDGQTVYGHKQTLAMGSPVFESMFFGELKEQRDVIEIQDLTLVGFKNALRYIYGSVIDFELFDLYDSYMAADKYLLHHFSEAFFEYVKGRLNADSSCLIYDQLIKVGEREEISLADVRTMIFKNSKKTLESEHFTQIDQKTLISLLSLDELSVDEIDLVAAVSKWVDCEVQRQGLVVNLENQRKVFEPIKGYVLFTALAPEKISNCKEIAKLLTLEERGSLVLHVLNKEHPWIELKSPRKAGSGVRSVFATDSSHIAGYSYSRVVRLTVSRRVRILTIFTTYSERASNLSLKILNPNNVDLGLKIERSVKDGRLCFSVDPPFDVQPNSSYTLVTLAHTGDGFTTNEDQLSKPGKLNVEGFVFDLKHPNYDYHCVRGLEFLALD